jgi:quinolinate synthase
MEYVASGDVSADGVHMLSTGGMLKYAEALERVAGGAAESAAGQAAVAFAGSGAPQTKPREAVVATEIGMLHPLRMAAPDVRFIPANPKASCKYMKMITLPKLRDALREMKHEVRVPEEIAVKARVPIDRMVALG